MQLKTRKILDKSFSGLGIISIIIMALSLVILLSPIIYKGMGAFFFTGTIEHRRLMLEKFERGNRAKIEAEIKKSYEVKNEAYEMIDNFKKEMKGFSWSERSKYKKSLRETEDILHELIGPASGENPVLIRQQYGQTRWDRAQVKLKEFLFIEDWDYSGEKSKKIFTPRNEDFKNTSLEQLFPFIENNLKKILLPKKTFYWQFLTDNSMDAHFFGGIWPEFLGTIYLTIGAMLFAIPFGVIAAIYLAEYAKEGKLLSLLRICISTLAGVPSIVFGLFGLAFFINTMNVSDSKSVLAGSMTLAILILPTIIRASEEAIKAVPQTYKEAALSLGATKFRTILNVILPAALPGILTGIVISMGRAAGETAPIIFTAAVSVGKPLKFWQTLNQPTPALPWNIYNLATEHEAVNEIRHVQFGMVFTLILLVLSLNLIAIIMRARISKKLRG